MKIEGDMVQLTCPYCGEELDTLIFRETGAYQLPKMIKTHLRQFKIKSIAEKHHIFGVCSTRSFIQSLAIGFVL